MYTSLKPIDIGVEVDADSPWCQATFCSDTDYAGVSLNKGQFAEFCKIVHFGYQKLPKPWCDNTIAVKVVHFGGVEQRLGIWFVFGP